MGRTACAEPQCLYKGALYLYLIGEDAKLKCSGIQLCDGQAYDESSYDRA